MKIGFLLVIMLLWSCAHEKSAQRSDAKGSGSSFWSQDRDSLRVWLAYTSEIEQMSQKDLKQEIERLRKLPNDSDAEVRMAIAQASFHADSHAYQKAAECLQAASTRTSVDAETRLWLKHSTKQMTQLAQLDKELAEEKKQRLELEKKMKALSDIELEMRQRDKNRALH